MDDGWKLVEVEHAVVEVHRNGDAASSVGCHAGKPDEGRKSLLSQAGLLSEEPVKRNGKANPASTSLFKWEFNVEQEREEELVGAGRCPADIGVTIVRQAGGAL